MTQSIHTRTAGARRPALRLAAAALAVAALGATLPGCAPLLVGGAMVGGTMMYVDRRTSGAQVEDQGIELKAASRVRELALPANVNITSYNRLALISGEVPDAESRQRVEEAVTRIENVRSVVNDLVVAPPAGVGERANDGIISGKVKAAFIDAKDLQAQAAKVVTEHGVVYLMGRVTEREANRFAEVARGVNGVRKVVRVFEVISEAELATIQPKPAN